MVAQPLNSRATPAKHKTDWIWVLLLLDIAFEYLRPSDWFLKFATPLRLAGVVGFSLVAVFLIKGKHYLREDRIFYWLIAFWLLIGVTTFFAPNDRAAFDTTVSMFLLFCVVFSMNLALTSPERIYKFMFFWIFIQTILAIYVIFHNGHGPGSFLLDENDVSLVLNMALPFPMYISTDPRISKRTKWLLYLSIAILLGAVGVAGSRGAVVGLSAVSMVMLAFSKRPIRNGIVLASVVSLGLVILLKLLPAAYINDMESIDDPQESTADERLWSWSIGWVMYKEHPVLGVGANNYQWTNHLYAARSPMYRPDRKILGGRVAHSLYFTLLPELGTVGAVIFGGLVVMMYNRHKKIRAVKAVPEKSADKYSFELLAKALTASMVACLVTGVFISVLYYPPFWHLIGITTATFRCAKSYFAQFWDTPPAIPGRKMRTA